MLVVIKSWITYFEHCHSNKSIDHPKLLIIPNVSILNSIFTSRVISICALLESNIFNISLLHAIFQKLRNQFIITIALDFF